MKILKLRLKNLNSLMGEWVIDFENPTFEAEGLFAITGPTGAGKSTLFDGVSLGLFGRTPRLRQISGSTNEIMSRQTGECFAEVTFETPGGRYRCHWSQHRANLRPEGALQPPRHEVSHVDTGKVLASGTRDTAAWVEQLSGMDFDRFTRSMLLAQGAFDRFLQANHDERAVLLEKITGSGRYSEISKEVFERHKAEVQVLKGIEAELGNVEVLTQEQEEALRADLGTLQHEDAQSESRLNADRKAAVWLEQTEKLGMEIESMNTQAALLESRLTAFSPERERLENAERAAVLEGDYATLQTMGKQQLADEAALMEAQAVLPALQREAAQSLDRLNEAERHAAALKQELAQLAPLFQKLRSLDQNLAGLSKSMGEEQARCSKDALAIEQHQKAVRAAIARGEEARLQLDRIGRVLVETAVDECIKDNYAGIDVQLRQRFARSRELSKKRAELEQASKERVKSEQAWMESGKRVLGCQRELETAESNLQQGKTALEACLEGKLLREYRAEKEHLHKERELLAVIASMEEQRKELVDGAPCPLCGAEHHPYRSDTKEMRAPGDLDKRMAELEKRIEDAEVLGQHLQGFEVALGKMQQDRIAAESHKILADQKLAQLSARCAALAAEGDELQQMTDQEHQELLRLLQPMGIGHVGEDAGAGLLETLRGRMEARKARWQEKETLEKQIAHGEAEIRQLHALVEQQRGELAQKRQVLEQLQRDHATVAEERQRLFGSRSVDVEEQRLQAAVGAAEGEEKTRRTFREQVMQRSTALGERIDVLRAGIAGRAKELEALRLGFELALVDAGFPTGEDAWMAARLSVEERRMLARSAKQLDDEKATLQGQLEDRRQRHRLELEKRVTDKNLDELRASLHQTEDQLKALRAKAEGLRLQLQSNEDSRQRQIVVLERIDAQKKILAPWSTLNELIGSADGAKFRTYAQGLTLGAVVHHANQQLQKMSDRYYLLRDEQKAPLELLVCDRYQAGEIRSTKNLSGGESFIVSLSLALGLSNVASQKVRVDSLFLDEGFGTLDEESLETALQCLTAMRQEGKLIGVISHVESLKQRLRAQIQIEPVGSSGRSRISGPGCAQVHVPSVVPGSARSKKKSAKPV
jgi:exonuclease SbcC